MRSVGIWSVARLRPHSQLSQEQADRFVDRAKPLAQSLLSDSPAPGELPVRAQLASPESSPYGAFMIAWPEQVGGDVVVHFLSDCSFFMYLLELSYRAALENGPALHAVFHNGSRLQIAITNDVLQCFVPNPPAGRYSMVRHHALMHLAATLWLDKANRQVWFSLYQSAEAEAITLLRGAKDVAAVLKDVEERAFDVFQRLRWLTLDEQGSAEVLRSHREVKAVTTYLKLCGVAIGLLGREYFQIPASHRQAWLRAQIHAEHQRPDFLVDSFERLACRTRPA